jgi:hypothetical protein
LAICSSSTIATALFVAVTTVLFQIPKWATEIFTSLAFCQLENLNLRVGQEAI